MICLEISEIKKLINPHKPYKEDRYTLFMRSLAPYFMKPLKFLGVTPNFITLLNIPLILFSSVLYLSNNYGILLLGAFLFQVHNLFDKLDGSLARFTGKTSLFVGKYVDFFIDHFFAMPVLYLFISLGVFFRTSNLIYLFLGIVLIMSYFFFEAAVHVVYKLYLNMNYIPDKHPSRRKASKLDLLKKIVRITYLPPTSSLVVLIFTVFNRLDLFLIIFGITYPFLAIFNVYYEGKIASKNLDQ